MCPCSASSRTSSYPIPVLAPDQSMVKDFNEGFRVIPVTRIIRELDILFDSVRRDEGEETGPVYIEDDIRQRYSDF